VIKILIVDSGQAPTRFGAYGAYISVHINIYICTSPGIVVEHPIEANITSV